MGELALGGGMGVVVEAELWFEGIIKEALLLLESWPSSGQTGFNFYIYNTM